MAEPTVADIMQTAVPVASPIDSVAHVARLLVASRLPGIPVLDGDEIVGVVTERDLIERQAEVDVPEPIAFFDAIFAFDAGRRLSDELRHVLGQTVADIMSHPVYNIKSRATLNELATLMVTHHANPVPVVDDDHKLVGIVTRADLVNIIARLESE